MIKELEALITAGSILLAPASSKSATPTKTIDQLASQSANSVSLPPKDLSPLERFDIANQTYQTFDASDLKETSEQLTKYSEDWISKLPDKSMQAEAYHQYAFTSFTKIITSIIQSCYEISREPICQSMFMIYGKLDEMVSNKQVPPDYIKLITDAKKFSDKALQLNHNPPKYQNLNGLVSETMARLIK